MVSTSSVFQLDSTPPHAGVDDASDELALYTDWALHAESTWKYCLAVEWFEARNKPVPIPQFDDCDDVHPPPVQITTPAASTCTTPSESPNNDGCLVSPNSQSSSVIGEGHMDAGGDAVTESMNHVFSRPLCTISKKRRIIFDLSP